MKRVLLARPKRSSTSYVKKDSKSAEVGGRSVSPLKGDTHTPNRTRLRTDEGKPQQSLDDLLAAAEQLPAAERKQLLARLALGSQTGSDAEARDVDMWAQAVYDELAKALGGEGGSGAGPLVVKRVVGLPAAWAPVRDFMADSKLDRLKVVERQSVYGLLAKLATEKARYVARRGGAPLSAKLVGNCAANMSAIFDQAFPGYLKSGLAPLVAKQLVASR